MLEQGETDAWKGLVCVGAIRVNNAVLCLTQKAKALHSAAPFLPLLWLMESSLLQNACVVFFFVLLWLLSEEVLV